MDVRPRCPNGLRGDRQIPGDKSISHRALLIGALAEGATTIGGLSSAADVRSTLNCLQSLGVQIDTNDQNVIIHGKGPHGFKKPVEALDAGNSGTTMRLLSGILAGQRFDSVLVGDSSLSRRPMKRIIEPLRLMGADINGTPEFTAPLRFSSAYNLRPIDYDLRIPSAQVKSAVLFAGLYTNGVTKVIEYTPTRDHTERMLGLKTSFDGTKHVVEVKGGQKIPARNFTVPGDISAATFLIAAAALVPNSRLIIRNVGMNKSRTAVLDVFRRLNVKMEIQEKRTEGGEDVGDIAVETSRVEGDLELSGEMVAQLIDEIPMLAVLALFSNGSFVLHDAVELRHKESDRIASLVQNVRRLGVAVEEQSDGFSFGPGQQLSGCPLESYGDHRIAMAFGVLGLLVEGVTIRGAECVDISFPGFWSAIAA